MCRGPLRSSRPRKLGGELRGEMCTAAWGILDGHTVPEGYNIYAKTHVDRMMSMSSELGSSEVG